MNSYNIPLLQAWRANLDVQYVMNVYACAKYVASYVTKSQRGMSKLLRKATNEVRQGNNSVKDQLRYVGNKFLNAVELNAQEASYILLGPSMRKASRVVRFINTNTPEDCIILLNSQQELQEFDDEAEEISLPNIFTRYENRPSALEMICLGEISAYYK